MSNVLTAFGAHPAVIWVPLAAFFGLVAVTLFAFGVRTATHGLARSPRVAQAGGSTLLGEYLMECGVWFMSPVARVAARLRVHPDVLSWLSLLLHFMAAYLLSQGDFVWGGWMLFLGAICDSLDGTVARATGLASDAGEVLDAAIDRWAEIAVFFAYAWYYRDYPLGFVLAAAACSGAVMVSYSKAKGEGFNVHARLGMMQRHERAVYLFLATLIAALVEMISPSTGKARYPLVLVALGLIAVLANITGIRRTAFIRRELRKR